MITEADIFNALKKILHRAAPLKVVAPVFPETSLADDLDFDSLDTMEMLVDVNRYFSINVDFEKWIEQESEKAGRPFTVGSMCRFIMETMNRV